MGRSMDWFRERPERVRRVITEHLQRGEIHLGLVYAISREISDEPNSESHVFELALMLGYLPAGVLRRLINEAFDMLRQETEDARYRAVALIEERVQAGVATDDQRHPWEVPVADIRSPEKVGRARLVHLAVVCDALAMAISTPEQDRPWIVY